MTQIFRRFSEPFAATGNMHGKGFQRLLGRPALSLVQTVIREALQNCVDASLPGRPTDVLIRLRTLSRTEAETLRSVVLSDLPPSKGSRNSIFASISKPDLKVLEIADFNTVGLAGPTRADIVVHDDEPHNFVNFLRNVGANRDVHLGGGTYGYGKTSLYTLSSCATILTDSVTTHGHMPTRRLMACHLGDAFDDSDESGVSRRYTGRHWWGGIISDGNLEPVEGAFAGQVAADLGLPMRPGGHTGTTIVVIDPMFDSDNPDDIGDDLMEAVLWNFWPRMTEPTPQHKRLRARLEIEGRDVPIPPPEHFPPLDQFSIALQRVRSNEGAIDIRCESPRKLLGRLYVHQSFKADRVGTATRSSSVIPPQSAHIAVMRPVELVVKYIPGDPLPDPRHEWAGVFVCSDDEEVEAAFAEAEPPAHDDWIPSNLPKGHARTFVNVALRRLAEHARRSPGVRPPHVDASEGKPPLAATASKLGKLLTATSTKGAARPGSRSTSTVPRHQGIAIQRPRFCRLETDDNGELIAVFEAVLHNDGRQPNLTVMAQPHLVADGARADADDLPEEFQTRLIRMELPSASLATTSNELMVGTASGTLRIFVRTPADAAVGVKATLRLEIQ